MSDGRREIDLAGVPDFRIGGLLVSPSTCQVRSGADGEPARIEPKVMEVLLVLWQAEGRTVSRDVLIARCWNGRAVSDDAVTRVIARLRALGRSADQPHFALETIPKVGYRLAANEQPVASAEPSAPPAASRFAALTGKRAVPAAIAALIVLAGVAWLAVGRAPAVSAVMPDHVSIVAFATLGPEPELVTLARKAQDAAVQRLTETGIPAATIAPGGAPSADAELRLQGGVERNGGEYVVRAALSMHPSGLVLWSGRFSREPRDLAGLEEEAAYALAEGLVCAKTRAARWRTARESLLPLLFEICFSGTMFDPERKVAAARRLVEAAPDLAFSHGRLALALAEQATAFAHLPSQTLALAGEAVATAKKALALDNDVAAHLALAARGSRQSLVERERHLKHALDLEPQNVMANQHYNLFLLEVGRVAAARENLSRTERWPTTAFYRAQIDAMRGDRLGAEQQLAQLAIVRPSWARDGRLNIAAFWEDPRTAIEKLPALAAAEPRSGDQCLIAHVAVMARAGGAQHKGLPATCDALPVDWRVRMLARQGDVEGAFALLEGPWPLTRTHWFLFYPEMRVVRADPRFRALAERLGLLGYWRETKQWPDFCKEAGLQHQCR